MTEPTDAEIDALLRPFYESDDAAEMAKYDDRLTARAVLAKWGQPQAGAGEPVAEMVPFHTPSGKRVAVISRFQHLPIGTKLYAHPQPAAQDAEDAKRYRWLRRNAIGAFRTNDGKGPVSVYHLCKIPAIPGIPEETDAAIDAAIAAQQGDSHE